MPVQGGNGGTAALAAEIGSNQVRMKRRPDQQNTQRRNSTEQVKSMRAGNHVEQRIVRIVPQVKALGHQLPQRQDLRHEKSQSNCDRDFEPKHVTAPALAFQSAASAFQSPTADQNKSRTEPEQMRNLNMLPIHPGSCTREVGKAHSDEQHRNGDQHEAHGQQTGARDIRVATAVLTAIVSPTAAARIARKGIAGPSAAAIGKLAFLGFKHRRHTFKITRQTPARGWNFLQALNYRRACYSDSEVFSRHYRKVKAIFGATDLLLISIAFLAAYQTRLFLPLEKNFYLDFRVAALLLALSAASSVAVGYWLEVYERLDSAHPRVVLRDTFRQCALGAICLVVTEFLLRLDLSRSFVLLFGIYAWILLCLFRINAARLIGALRREFGKTHIVMVVGCGENAFRLGRALEQSKDYGIRLLGFLDEKPGQVRLSQNYEQYPFEQLPELLRRHVIDEVIFAVGSRRLGDMEELFLRCDEEGVRTRVVVDFFPHVNSQVYLDRLGSTPLLTFSAAPHDEIRLLAKRVMDVMLAAAGLVLLLPFMLIIWLLIRCTSPGPVIFRQERCGLNGRRFVFYKFRSMCYNAEEMKASLTHLSQKSTAFKIPNDPRLTAIGRFLRKFSIDEWPQLWNVLKGDMSLVGPRPAVPEEVDHYQTWQRRRLRMRPGLTCLWAIAGRDTLDFETWMKMDMQYIDNWSLALDCNIMLRTIPRVLTGRGAY